MAKVRKGQVTGNTAPMDSTERAALMIAQVEAVGVYLFERSHGAIDRDTAHEIALTLLYTPDAFRALTGLALSYCDASALRRFAMVADCNGAAPITEFPCGARIGRASKRKGK